MRNLRIIVTVLFLVVSVAFAAVFSYDRLMVDHEAPQIVCDGEPLRVSVTATDAELCAGLSAYDDTDGDITDRIIVRKISQLTGANSASIDYAVFDSSSNYCVYNRPVYYTDYRKPRFSLTRPLSFPVSSTATLSDCLFAEDVIDGDISQRIRIAASNVNISQLGEYPITAQVTNSLGDTALVNLTVTMENLSSRHPVLELSEYIYYVEQGEALSEETLRGLITEVRPSASAARVDVSAVKITGTADTSKRGSYDIRYAYTNEENLTRTVILTVVVE